MEFGEIYEVVFCSDGSRLKMTESAPSNIAKPASPANGLGAAPPQHRSGLERLRRNLGAASPISGPSGRN